MATALTNYHTGKTALCATLVARATTELGNAETRRADAQAALAQISTQAADLDTQIAGARAALAAPEIGPADAETLAAQLRDHLIARNKITARQLGATEALAQATVARDTYRGLVAEAEAQERQATEDADAANAKGTQHDTWLSSDTADEIAALAAEATTLLAEISGTPASAADPESEAAARRALIVAAKARVEGDIPEVLRDHARGRVSRRVTLQTTALETQLGEIAAVQTALLAALAPIEGAVAPAQQAYDDAEAALAAAAARPDVPLDRALSMLQSIVDSPALTSAQTTRIAEVALAADADALTTESDLDTAWQNIRSASVELESARLAALLADPSADPATDTDVQAAEAALTALQGSPLSDAEAAHTAEHILSLDTWDTAVPGQAWANLANYDAAIAQLSALSGVDLPALVTAFTDAEADLVDALLAADEPPRARAIVAAAKDAAAARLATRAETLGQHIVSAQRGDA